MTKQKQFNLSKTDALKIIETITDHDDPHWDNAVEDHYDEATDSWPSIYDVLRALGVTKAEYLKAHPGASLRPKDWPETIKS